MRFSRIEIAAIRRLLNGARIMRTFGNETSLQKWIDAGLAQWDNSMKWAVISKHGEHQAA